MADSAQAFHIHDIEQAVKMSNSLGGDGVTQLAAELLRQLVPI